MSGRLMMVVRGDSSGGFVVGQIPCHFSENAVANVVRLDARTLAETVISAVIIPDLTIY